MAVTEGQQTPDPFELEDDGDARYSTVGDDIYDGGKLGLHLGVLRRFAAMAPAKPSRSNRPAVDR